MIVFSETSCNIFTCVQPGMMEGILEWSVWFYVLENSLIFNKRLSFKKALYSSVTLLRNHSALSHTAKSKITVYYTTFDILHYVQRIKRWIASSYKECLTYTCMHMQLSIHCPTRLLCYNTHKFPFAYLHYWPGNEDMDASQKKLTTENTLIWLVNWAFMCTGIWYIDQCLTHIILFPISLLFEFHWHFIGSVPLNSPIYLNHFLFEFHSLPHLLLFWPSVMPLVKV